MRVGVRFVFELTAQEPAVHLREFDRFRQHPTAFEARRGEHDLGTEKAHQLAAFDAEVLSHCYHERVALLGAHHCESDPRVATRRLDDRLSRLQTAAAFGVLNDTEREAILDGSHWIECLDLDIQADVRRRELLDLHHRRVANRFKDAVKPVLGTIHETIPLQRRTTGHTRNTQHPARRHSDVTSAARAAYNGSVSSDARGCRAGCRPRARPAPRERGPPARPALAPPARDARGSRERTPVRADPGRWRPRARGRAARARRPAPPSRCRCRRPGWTMTSRRVAEARWRPG